MKFASLSYILGNQPYELYPVAYKARALWSFLARFKDEMTMEQGDIIQLERIYRDGWALGRKLPVDHHDNRYPRLVPLLYLCSYAAWNEVSLTAMYFANSQGCSL